MEVLLHLSLCLFPSLFFHAPYPLYVSYGVELRI